MNRGLLLVATVGPTTDSRAVCCCRAVPLPVVLFHFIGQRYYISKAIINNDLASKLENGNNSISKRGRARGEQDSYRYCLLLCSEVTTVIFIIAIKRPQDSNPIKTRATVKQAPRRGRASSEAHILGLLLDYQQRRPPRHAQKVYIQVASRLQLTHSNS